DRLLPVVPGHHLVGQFINGILNPAVFGIDQNRDIAFKSFFTNPVNALPYPLPGSRLLRREFFARMYLLQELKRGEAGGLEDGKRDSRISLCLGYRVNDLLISLFERGFVLFALSGIVQNGTHLELIKLRDGFVALINGFSPAKMPKYRPPDKTL